MQDSEVNLTNEQHPEVEEAVAATERKDNEVHSTYERYATWLPTFMEAVAVAERSIIALCNLELLQCNGAPPDLQALPDQYLRQVALMALTDKSINVLPDHQELSYINVSGNPSILAQDKASIVDALSTMLKARGYKLSNEVILMAVNIKLNRLYNNISEPLGIVVKELTELPSTREVQVLIEAYKQATEDILVNKKRDIDSYLVKSLEVFVGSLHNAPDHYAGVTPKTRLEVILSTLEENPTYTLDLRAVNLGETGHYLKEMNISRVNLLLNPEQEELYLTREQREERGDGIIRAARTGDVEKINRLCRFANYRDSQGRTALMAACMANQVEAVHTLLQHRANVDERTASGYSIIEGLSQSPPREDNIVKRKEIITLLINAGANVSDLHVAAAFGDLENTKTLYPPEVLNRKVNGYAPIHIAIINGRLDNVVWLHKKNANISLADDYGRTPLELAYERGHRKVISFLTEKGAIANITKAINATIGNGQFLIARVLIDRHGGLEQRRMLGAALKDILRVGVVSKEGFIPVLVMPPEAILRVICFVSTSYMSRDDANELRNDIITRNQAAMARGFVVEEVNRRDSKGKECILC